MLKLCIWGAPREPGRANGGENAYHEQIGCFLEKLGFKISWKLVCLGLFGDAGIPPVLTRGEVIAYLTDSLIDVGGQIDDIVRLICEENDSAKFDARLRQLADGDSADTALQKRKWRAYLLKNTLDNMSGDCLRGLLELMEFWMSMGKPDDCPMIFPDRADKESVQSYFTKEAYECFLLGKHTVERVCSGLSPLRRDRLWC